MTELLRIGDLEEFRLLTYTLKQIEDMRRFAIEHGWFPKRAIEDLNNG